MATKINDDSLFLEIDNRVIRDRRDLRDRAAADGQGAWIVSSYPGRLFTRN